MTRTVAIKPTRQAYSAKTLPAAPAAALLDAREQGQSYEEYAIRNMKKAKFLSVFHSTQSGSGGGQKGSKKGGGKVKSISMTQGMIERWSAKPRDQKARERLVLDVASIAETSIVNPVKYWFHLLHLSGYSMTLNPSSCKRNTSTEDELSALLKRNMPRSTVQDADHTWTLPVEKDDLDTFDKTSWRTEEWLRLVHMQEDDLVVPTTDFVRTGIDSRKKAQKTENIYLVSSSSSVVPAFKRKLLAQTQSDMDRFCVKRPRGHLHQPPLRPSSSLPCTAPPPLPVLPPSKSMPSCADVMKRFVKVTKREVKKEKSAQRPKTTLKETRSNFLVPNTSLN